MEEFSLESNGKMGEKIRRILNWIFSVKDRLDPLSQGRTGFIRMIINWGILFLFEEIEAKQGRACVALTWNQKHPNLVIKLFKISLNESFSPLASLRF